MHIYILHNIYYQIFVNSLPPHLKNSYFTTARPHNLKMNLKNQDINTRGGIIY
jgi:hypothetical protein